MPKKPKTPRFEEALNELETIVTQMEKGDLSLEESLAAFEKGIQLTRQCQTSLKEAEQKVQILMEKNGRLEAEDFSDDNTND